MRRNPHTASMRFINDGSELFQTRKGLVHHFSIGLEVERPGCMYFDVVDPIMGVFAHCRAQGLNSICLYVLFKRFEFQREGRVSRHRYIDDWASRQQAWTLNEAALDGFFKLYVGIPAAMRPHRQ